MRVNSSKTNSYEIDNVVSQPEQKVTATEVSQPEGSAKTGLGKALRQAEMNIGAGLRADQLRSQTDRKKPSASFLGRSQTQPLTMADYRREAETIIKGAGSDREARNAAITGAYADMFEKNPLAFKWAGMAAHASFIVGMGIKTGRIGQAASPYFGSQLRNMLTEGNNAVFADVYPIFLAYQRGGMAELNRLGGSLSGSEFESFRPLYSAFAKIDQGTKLYKSGETKKGTDLIWEGNRDLLRHEQLDLLQSAVYDKYSFTAALISPFMMADFDDTYGIDSSTFSAFWKNHTFSSMANPTERMNWLEGELLPIWRRQNEQKPDLVLQHMETFRKLGVTAGAKYL